MRSSAKTVEEYLDDLPEERLQALETVREVILANLPEGYEEAMNWGMITYQVPLEIYPDTYNQQPLEPVTSQPVQLTLESLTSTCNTSH